MSATVTAFDDKIFITTTYSDHTVPEALQLIGKIAGALASMPTPAGFDAGEFEVHIEQLRLAAEKLQEQAERGIDEAVPRQRR